MNSLLAFSQVRIYKGFIDKYPIQLITNSYGKTVNAIYTYNKFDTPITINGKLKNDTLTLFEKTEKGEVSAILKFYGVDSAQNKLHGAWIDQTKESRFKIELIKSLEFDSFDAIALNRIELLQAESTEKHYFKLLLSKKSSGNIRTVGVRVYRKGTDKLIQEINVFGDFRSINGLWVGDYNFDGLPDFSVFGTSFSGANTSSTYLLRTPNSEKYFKSEIGGLSLQFDSAKKEVYEHNQCCAGSKEEITTYKIVKNKMYLIKKKCLEYDEETETFVEVKCE
ncbi:MAG: hypothetical protein ACI85I_000474 [Arenicella sp.]|jgi:hypothetical protein